MFTLNLVFHEKMATIYITVLKVNDMYLDDMIKGDHEAKYH